MKTKILICLIAVSFIANAQTANGNIEIYVGDLINNAPGSSGNDYKVPTTVQLITWNTIIDFLLADNLASARTTANGLNYQVTEFTDTTMSPNQVFYILEEQSPKSNYWGAYVFSKTPKRGNLVIQAPHIKNDTNTGKQAVYCFKNNMARSLFISGTHRCNNSSSSSCSGTTTICNSGSEAYRVSDLAHNTNSVFQKTTENMFTYFPESVFIQLHGFSWSSGDPYVIMSNGTRETPAIDYATLIKDALLVEDNSLTFELSHINTSWNTLIGFTNTQGRLINYSVDNCVSSAEGTTGRFIHIEQELTKLRANSTAWQKMSNTLASVFIEDGDGDGVATGSDSDDNDACDPEPYYANCGVCDVIITKDNFDSADGTDLGNWNDGGNNAFKSEINSLGDKSIRLKHGIETGNTNPDVDPQSSIFTNLLNLSAYSQLKIEFSFFPPTTDGYENSDDFLLEISTDGGINYTVFKSWVAGTDFNLGFRYFDSVLVTGFTFTSNTVIRIRSHANDDLDRVYIDNIVIKGCNDSGLSTAYFNLEQTVKIFPNPSSGQFTIKGNDILEVTIFNLLGEEVSTYKNTYNKSSLPLNLEKEISGIYFLNIKTSASIISKKVIRL